VEGKLIPSASLDNLLQLTTLTLATASAGGEPHAASVYFAADRSLNLYFFSDPGSQHGHDLVENPRAAVTFSPECENWQDIRGVQMRGEAQPVPPGPGWELGWAIYSAKFPFVAAMREIVARNQLYTFRPDWIRLIDNRRGFGFKEEWERSEESRGPASGWRQKAPTTGASGREDG
jgi:uncharacterized protein YhbP (UPF0306 family)